ncbi:P-loop containing nucleoside triphosphate hydrolase protein, partial [Pavlovales sp. CCMP2436]
MADVPYAPDFTLGEDNPSNAAARLAQEARWAGTNVDARQAFSVRETARLYEPALRDAQDDFYTLRMLVRVQQRGTSILARLSPDLFGLVTERAMPGQGPLVRTLIAREHERPAALAARRADDASAPFRVFVRVRPLLAYELTAGEYSALDCTSSARALVCHDGRLARSGRQLTMTHKFYACDSVIKPDATDTHVYERALAPLLARVLDGRGDATLLLYGQTGAGKTHTLMQLIGQLATHLPAAEPAATTAAPAAEPAAASEDGTVAYLPAAATEDRTTAHLVAATSEPATANHAVVAAEPMAEPTATVTATATAEPAIPASQPVAAAAERALIVAKLTFFEVGGKELAGGSANDLLNARAPVKLCCDAEGATHVLGATVRAVANGAELLDTMARGLALRSTEQTERNPLSSRSHAVCVVRFTGSGKVLRLVDLAGSERNAG